MQEAPVQVPAATYEQQYQRARVLLAAGQPDLAIAAFSALLAQSPANADVLLGRGIAYTRNKQYGEAERDLRAAAAAAPDYPDVWQALASVYIFSQRPAEAAAAYTELIRLQPGDAAHRLARAAAYRYASQPGHARADLDAAAAMGADAARIADLRASLSPAPIASAMAAVSAPVAEAAAPAASTAAPQAGQSARTAVPELAIPAGYQWSAGVSASATRIALRDQRWNEQGMTVRRHFQTGSLGFEALRASRFGQHGQAWALDGYASLWDGAYANVRFQRAPAERLFPRKSWRAELYQAVGGGWELAASDDRLHFGASRVDIYGVAVARYVGDFYLRLRHTRIVSGASRSTGDRAVLRYYYAGDGDNYVEAAASQGRSDDPLALATERDHNGGAALNWVRYVTPRWGYKLGLSYARDSVTGSERTLSGGLSFRW